MPFRILATFSYLLFVIKPGLLLGIEQQNAFEKIFFLLAALSFPLGRKVNPVVITLLGICLAMVLALGALTSFPDFSWLLLLGALNQILVIYLMIAAKPNSADCKLFLYLVPCLAPLCAGAGLFYHALGLYNTFPVEFNTGAARFSGTLNAAFLSGLSISGIFVGVRLLNIRRNSGVAFILLNLLILLAAGGRGALAVIVLVAPLTFLLSHRWDLRAKLTALGLGIPAAIAALPVVWVAIGARLQNSGLSGREGMWTYLLELSDKYPNFGVGFGHQYWIVPRSVYILFTSSAAHNDYLRLLVELGWFGVFAFYTLLIIAFVSAWNFISQRRDAAILITFAGYLLLSVSDNALSTSAYFLLPIAAVMTSGTEAKSVRRVRRVRKSRSQVVLPAGSLGTVRAQ